MRFLYLSLLGLFLFTSCDDKKDATQILVDAGYSDYVNAFTSGVIGSKSNIKIVLTQPSSKAKPGQLLEAGVLELDPQVDGQALWVDNQTIEFRPNEKLTSGETYTVELNLDELMTVKEGFETMEFAFTVIKQSLFVSFNGLSTVDVHDLTKQELKGSIRTSDQANDEEIEKCLSASQNGKQLEVVWEHKSGSRVHAYLIKGITRGDAESFVNIEWNGDAIGSETNDSREFRIPPLGEFTLLEVNTQRTPALHFSVQFSDPIQKNQDLTGLVYLKSGKKLRLKIDKNEIKAFPLEKLKSEEVIVIDKSIRNIQGNELQESYEREVEFNVVNPSVELIGKGVIMPTSGNIAFPFKAINLRAVNLRIIKIFEDNIPQFMQENQLDGYNELTRVGQLVYDGTVDLVSEEPIDYGVWNNFSVDIANIIEPEVGAIYRVMLSYERYQSLYPCGDESGEIKPLKRQKLNFVDGNSYFSPNNWYEGRYNWNEKDDPCSDSYYQYYQRAISTNIISSNLGIIAKESADDHYDIIVTDLRTADPIRGVKIEVLNYQNRTVGEGKTNGDGQVRIKTKGKPYLIVAKNGDQKGYLRVDNGSALSVSLFDVGGKDIKKGIKGYIYGERGVWRPGDTVHLSFMLEDKLNALPETHPIVLELRDPTGKLYDKRVVNEGVKGLYYFKLHTLPNDITGLWQVKIMVGNSTFYKSLKIETIKPNRLKINLDFDDVLTSSQTINSTLTAKWLYGTPGSGLTTKIEYELANLNTTFKGFDDYEFDDRSKRYYPDDSKEAEGVTNNEGKVKLFFPFDAPTKVPGMLKMKFRTKVFEPGGDFSQDYISARYSPYRSYVGIKVDRGQNWMNAINTEDEQAISIASVSEFGKPLSKNISIEVYKLGWRWWWEGNGENELTQYINSYDKELIKTDNVQIANGKSMYSLKFDKPTWGRLLIVAKDLSSGHSASKLVYADYPGWWSNDGSGAKAASMLSIETNKPEYNVGEQVQISAPSGGVGNLYVTVEKGDKILDQFWVEAGSSSTEFEVEATAEMAPNVYISATLIQPHAQTENSLPIRVYGVIPVTINDPQTHVNPVIKAPDETKPETIMEVEVSEEEGKPMAYSIAVVDEGLLSLTRFKTPNAWSTFYSKEALKIRTWDLYDYVMSAKTGKLVPLMAIGGDEALNMEDDKDAKRFKPVVRYLGPFYLDDGDKNKHKIDIPNYVGAVRVMVVAGLEGAYGSAEKEVLVKQPLMVTSTLPRVLGPSEKIRVPVNVISMKDKAQNVSVKVTSNDLMKIVGSSTQKISFSEAGEQTIFFEFEIAKKLGVAKLRVDVKSGQNEAYEEQELKVRAPNPYISNTEPATVEPGKTWNKTYNAIGIKGSNSATFSVTRLPDIALQKQLEYLIRYPHGCIEQTTSSAFPQLFLSNLVELTAAEEEKIQDNVIAALNRLRKFQMSNGAMSYWPGTNSYLSEWGTNYAGHFMIEAKAKGYDLPPGLVEQWAKFQRSAAADWNRRNYTNWGRYGGDLTQAYRLYTLALNGSPEVGAMNRLKNDNNLSKIGAWRLAAAYALIGREDAARELAQTDMTVEKYRETGYSYESHLRDQAIIIEALTYFNEKEKGGALIRELAKELKKGWHSTQTRAYSLLALSKFVGETGTDDEMSVSLSINGSDYSKNTDLPMYKIELKPKDLLQGQIQFENTSEQVLFLNFTQTGIPVEINQAPKREDLNMKITYVDMDNKPIDVTNLKQGTDFKALVKITHPGIRLHYKEIALNQIFPSGWQIINTRLNEGEVSNKPYNFQDIRDDRVYTYFDLGKGKTADFEVFLNATFCGKFYQPGVFCAPMYDESIQALDPGKWVEVTPKNGN